MINPRCGNCRHYEPVRNDAGRVLPSQPGRCNWLPAWPVMADSYLVAMWGFGDRGVNWPVPHSMYSHHGTNCKVWQKK